MMKKLKPPASPQPIAWREASLARLTKLNIAARLARRHPVWGADSTSRWPPLDRPPAHTFTSINDIAVAFYRFDGMPIDGFDLRGSDLVKIAVQLRAIGVAMMAVARSKV